MSEKDKEKTSATQGTQIEFQPGAIIFKEGDQGGDLYFIKEGEVEVYRESKGMHIPLALLKEGEILGIMTCLTRDPRLASARAKTYTKAMIVRQSGFKSLISGMPTWISTVIKDFVLRIQTMDELYTRAVTRMERQERDLSMLTLAGQLAAGLCELGDALTPGNGDERLVEIDEILPRLARILGAEGSDSERVFAVFAEVGLLKVDPKATERRAELAVLRRLASLSAFVREFLGSVVVRRGYESLSLVEAGALAALAERHRALGKPATSDMTLALADVPVGNADAIALKSGAAKAGELGLLKLEDGRATFTPQRLTQAMRHLSVLHKLRNVDRAKATDESNVLIITENY